MNQTRRELSLAESAAVTNEPLLQLQQVVQQQQQHQQHQNHHHSTVVSEPTQARNFFAQIIHQQLNPQSTSLPTLLTHSLVAFQNQLDNEVVAASVTPTTTTPTTTTSGTNSGDHQQHFRQHQQLQLLHQDHNHHHHQQYLHLQQQQQQQQQHLQQSSTNRQQQLVQQAHRYFTSTNALISSFSSPTSANLSPYSSLSLSPSATDNTFHQQQPIMQSMVAAAGSGTSAAASAAVTATSTAATTTTADWWTEYWSRQPFPSGYTQSSITLLACLITTIIFLIVVGNLLVCIAIFTEKSLRPTQNWFIASLAVSDMLLGLVVMPFSLARELMGFWIFGTLWCDIHEAVDVLLTTASINTLCLISLDRYWSITQAVSYLKKRTPRRGAFMIAFVWILSAAVSLPPLFGWKKPAVPTQAPVNKSASTTSWPMDIDAYAADNGNQVGGLSQQQQSRYQRLLERRELATPIQSADYGPLPEELLLDQQQQQNNATTISNAYAANANPPLSPTVIPPLPQLMTSATEYPTCQLSDDLGYVLYSAVGSFFIPCGVMVFTYIKIFLAARSRARRAINKQSRAGQGQNKQRLAARRANLNANQQAPVTHHNQVIGEPSSGAPLTAAAITGSASLKAQAHLQQQQHQSGELMVKGKLVIVERRKSQATVGQLPSASSLGDVVAAPELAMRELRSFAPGAQCIDEKSTAEEADTEQQPAAHRTSTAKIETLQSSDDSTTAITTTNESCTLTTSQAIHASPSALNSAASNDSSMITVMNASMGELPVTMFNFQRPEPQPQASTGGERTTDRKAAALLKAISEADRQLLSELDDANECDAAPAASALEAEGINSSARQVPDIVVERRGTGVSSSGTAVTTAATAAASQEVTQEATTNETCFMTIEEDSDIFDAQAGRTIMMIAGTATQRQASGLPKSQVMTMQPSGGQVCDSAQQQIVCSASSAQCRQQPRSASSYCGSSMTINDDDDEDEDDELDECPGDDEELTDECNRYSVSCTLDQCCPAAHCHECELAAGGCTCHLASNGADSPLKHHQHSGDSTAASGTANSGRHQHHQPESRCASDLEAQSMIGDDNVSHMTEYRSNEDLSSSVAGHDVLDATESYHHDKSAAVGGSRKRSLIGFRLTRLGSSGPLSSHSGGLLALVSSQQQQQQQQQQHNQQHHHHQQQQQQQQVSSSTGKNLKALRQNFFLKLNQLTAKSAAKSTEKSHKSNPSSAHSSGTEHEPSIDCPTTSAIQSNDYPQETTIVDEYEQQTSGDSHHSASKYLVDKELQATRRVSGAVSPHNADKQPASQLTLLARGAAAQANLKAANNQLHQSDDRALLLRATPQDKRMATSNNSTVVAISTTKGKELALRPKSRASGQQNHSLSGSGTKTSGTGGPVSRAYLASDNERHKRKLAKARERRATLILGLIMTTFICSWMPFFTFYVLRAICEDCRKAVSPRIEAFIFWMGYCNSAINPIIYTIFNRDFRKAFRKILFKCL